MANQTREIALSTELQAENESDEDSSSDEEGARVDVFPCSPV